jgi:hypothetical protein
MVCAMISLISFMIANSNSNSNSNSALWRGCRFSNSTYGAIDSLAACALATLTMAWGAGLFSRQAG